MTFRPHHDPSHLYFITATVLGWRQVFVDPANESIVLESLDWHRRNGRWLLYAYVLMPNHLHAVIKPHEGQTMSTVLQSFGSYTAHALLARFREEGRNDLDLFFARREDRDATKESQFWRRIQAKNVYSPEFLREKVEYIHSNPVMKHWHLVGDRADYPYSSACYYDLGLVPGVEVDDVRWLLA